MKPKRLNKRFLPMLWIGLGLWVGSMLISYILQAVGVELSGQDTLIDVSKVMFRHLPVFTLLLLTFFQPILEEMSFRLWGVGKKWTTVLCLVLMAFFCISSLGWAGALFVAVFVVVWLCVKNKIVQVWINAIVSSLAFTVCHISGFGGSTFGMLLGLTDIFGLALVCCWLTINISFWLSALLHVLNNSLAILLPLIWLPDAVTGSASVSVNDAMPVQTFKSVIEPLKPFADNASLLEGATRSLWGYTPADTTGFYMVGEPAEIACLIASSFMVNSTDTLFDWQPGNENLETRVVFRITDVNPEFFHIEDLYDHYMFQIKTYLDKSLQFDTGEVQLKEIWLVYKDGREVLLNDSCQDFDQAWSRVTSSSFGIKGNEILDFPEIVNDTTVEHHYYCRVRPNPLEQEQSGFLPILDKLYDYNIEYRDGRKVTYITIHQ